MISIEISNESKEKETQIHELRIKNMNFQNQMIIYIDDSKIDSIENLEAEIAYSKDNKEFLSQSWNLKSSIEVFDAELIVLKKVFELILKTKQQNSSLKKFLIFVNSQAAIQRIQKNKIYAGQYIVDQITRLIKRIKSIDSIIHIQIE